MNRVIALLLILALPYSLVAADAQNGYKVTYDGGSLLDTKAGTGLKLKISQEKIVFVENQNEVASIPTSTVTEISYGQDVHRRVGAAIGLAVVGFSASEP